MIVEFIGRRLCLGGVDVTTETHGNLVSLRIEAWGLDKTVRLDPEQIDQMLELIKDAREGSSQNGHAPVRKGNDE
jgi:hypothetical protein